MSIRIAVVGAGAFGGWTALELLRRGSTVTLLDGRGAGNPLSSSGGESRVLRFTYGADRNYLHLSLRSLELWREMGRRAGEPLFRRTGVLFLAGDGDKYLADALPHLREAGVDHEILSKGKIARRYPQIRLDRVRRAVLETEAGFLRAGAACEAVREAFVREGGEYRWTDAEPGPLRGGEMQELRLSDGTKLRADRYLFACGPWLGRLFPDLMGKILRVTRQEVFFFRTPAGDPRFSPGQLPIWADLGERFWYGIPGSDGLGFKIADDTRGPEFDPTAGNRDPTEEGLRSAREYLAFRFPGMKDAPLLESRVCQYSNTPDGNFVIDRHPAASNLWIAGGGSGHGFKHGPALGELIAGGILRDAPPEPAFRLDRFESPARRKGG